MAMSEYKICTSCPHCGYVIEDESAVACPVCGKFQAVVARSENISIFSSTTGADELAAAKSRISELEARLEDVQYSMATENTDLAMDNIKLKERIKELEEANKPKRMGADEKEKWSFNEVENFLLDLFHWDGFHDEVPRVLDYINQLRVDRLMAKAREFRNLETEALHKVGSAVIDDIDINESKSWETIEYQAKCIAEAFDSRAKRIKERM